jgi:hypothetical protein
MTYLALFALSPEKKYTPIFALGLSDWLWQVVAWPGPVAAF